MSTGGIFQLITNDGKQDRMLLATALLNKRLLEIERARSKNPHIIDPTPTLVDIERTHVLFMNAHFKPFCAIGYEYNYVGAQSGTMGLGAAGLQFSIPQFGDFFADMAIHAQLASVTATNAAYWEDPANNPPIGAELIAYVNYIGEALLRKVSITINGNPLDEYGPEVMLFHQKFFVTPNKAVGWNRNLGQEVPHVGYMPVSNVITGQTISAYGRGAGVREQRFFCDGYQTPKVTQPPVDLWIPLLFWFNTDPRLSIPSVSIPYGQRYINVSLAQANQIMQQLHAFNPALDDPASNPPPSPGFNFFGIHINNIFVNPEIHDIFIKRIGFNLIRVHRFQRMRQTSNNFNCLLQNMKWPIETIYFGFQPTENTALNSTLMLQNWDILSAVIPNTVDCCCLQNTYSFAQALASISSPNATQLSTNFVAATGAGLDFSQFPGNTANPAGNGIPNINQLNEVLTANDFPPLNFGTTVGTTMPTGAEIIAALPSVNCQATYFSTIPTLSRVQVEAHGVPLYRDLPASFFNSYIPYTYGGFNINTPDDVGAYMLTFNLYPGSYQPSGYVNISRAREFYFNYFSAIVGQNLEIPDADLIFIGIAINFLLISDGSAVLRYST